MRKVAKQSEKLLKIAPKKKPLTKKQRGIKKIQDEVIERVNKAKEYGNPINVSKWTKEAMLKHGYSERSARCLKVTQTKTWNQLLEGIPDSLTTDRLTEFVMDSDKRVAMDAIKEVHKIKNRYPAQRVKIEAFRDELSQVVDYEYE
ncbi:MAG: hypothetical protein PHE21_04245 [Candidatus Dojkabacteria bacterium]|nr:hypothetical protein [Candidatus Dojkabacteria bacterium]